MMHDSIKKHHRNSKIIFWIALVIGAITVIPLIIFLTGTFISEGIDPDIDFKLLEEFGLLAFFLCEVFIAGSLIISLFKNKIGAFLVILFVILANIAFWDHNVRLLHIPLLISGLMLIFLAHYITHQYTNYHPLMRRIEALLLKQLMQEVETFSF